MIFGRIMEPLLSMSSLDHAQAEDLMSFLIGGDATEAQTGAILTALRLKGCNANELAAFATVLRQSSVRLPGSWDDLVDTCGTGGGRPSFNISTAAAIVAAAAGVRVAKHGNRAITSRCGSADVLEALGVRLIDDPAALARQLSAVGIAFMFAPSHHPALRHAGKARRELGFRTVFNQLGPLANPAGAQRQLIGVYEVGLLQPMGEALASLGAHRALLAHGHDGLDEISPIGPSHVATVADRRCVIGTMSPSDFALPDIGENALTPGESLEENAAILLEAISQPDSLRSAAVLPSAAAAIWLAGVVDDLPEAARLARAAIGDGTAIAKLQALIEESQAG